jgi:hypothetical protein
MRPPVLPAFGVDQYEQLAMIHCMAQIQQTTMGAHHESLATFAKLPTLMAAPEGLQAQLVKNALAPTTGRAVTLRLWAMMRGGEKASMALSDRYCENAGQTFLRRGQLVRA